MDVFFLVNGMMNVYNTQNKLKTTNEIELEEFIGLLNPFVFYKSSLLLLKSSIFYSFVSFVI